MDRRRFQGLILQALERLPREFRRRMENIEILVEDWPPRREEGRKRSGELLGLYRGYPLKERGIWYGNVLPDQIIIYQGPIERACRNDAEIREQVKVVLLHEVGHYFGLDEEELRTIEEQDEQEEHA